MVQLLAGHVDIDNLSHHLPGRNHSVAKLQPTYYALKCHVKIPQHPLLEALLLCPVWHKGGSHIWHAGHVLGYAAEPLTSRLWHKGHTSVYAMAAVLFWVSGWRLSLLLLTRAPCALAGDSVTRCWPVSLNLSTQGSRPPTTQREGQHQMRYNECV